MNNSQISCPTQTGSSIMSGIDFLAFIFNSCSTVLIWKRGGDNSDMILSGSELNQAFRALSALAGHNGPPGASTHTLCPWGQKPHFSSGLCCKCAHLQLQLRCLHTYTWPHSPSVWALTHRLTSQFHQVTMDLPSGCQAVSDTGEQHWT